MGVGVFAPRGGSRMVVLRGALSPLPTPSSIPPPGCHLPPTSLSAWIVRCPGLWVPRGRLVLQHRCWCHASNRGSSTQGARINLSRCFANIPESQGELNCPLRPRLHRTPGRAPMARLSSPWALARVLRDLTQNSGQLNISS